jgi:hypothetical protein
LAGADPGNPDDGAANAPLTQAQAQAMRQPLTADQINALVLIEGEQGRGSGFVAKLHNQYFVVTNQHVLSGNPKFTLTGADGTVYPTNGTIYAAVDYDVAIIRIPAAKHALEVLDDPLTGTKPGDPVIVPGNSDGAGVIKQLHGTVLGAGPKLVEVDAKFVHGNSGSPIIHQPSGKVIGVATYVSKYHLDDLQKAADYRQLHWFGYRLDNIKKWEPIDWDRYTREGEEYEQIKSLTNSLIGAMTSANQNPAGDNAEINKAILQYQLDRQVALREGDSKAGLDAVQKYVGRLHALARKTDDIDDLLDHNPYSYHANGAKEQLEVRKEIDQALNSLNDALRKAQ